MYNDIYESSLSTAILFGQMLLISDDPVPRNVVPEVWHCYDLHGTEEDPWRPETPVMQQGKKMGTAQGGMTHG